MGPSADLLTMNMTQGDIGDPVTATDPDGETPTYSLGGADAASFDIDASSGQLQTKADLDYEMKSTYTVTVGRRPTGPAQGPTTAPPSNRENHGHQRGRSSDGHGIETEENETALDDASTSDNVEAANIRRPQQTCQLRRERRGRRGHLHGVRPHEGRSARWSLEGDDAGDFVLPQLR